MRTIKVLASLHPRSLAWTYAVFAHVSGRPTENQPKNKTYCFAEGPGMPHWKINSTVRWSFLSERGSNDDGTTLMLSSLFLDYRNYPKFSDTETHYRIYKIGVSPSDYLLMGRKCMDWMANTADTNKTGVPLYPHYFLRRVYLGPVVQNVTNVIANVTLKFLSRNMANTLIFLLQKCE